MAHMDESFANLSHQPDVVILQGISSGTQIEMPKAHYRYSEFVMVHLDDDDASPATEPFMVDDIVIQQAADLSAFLSKLAESPFSVSSVTTSVPLRKAGNRHVPKVLASDDICSIGYPAWARAFVEGLSEEALFKLYEAADFLFIKPLVLLCAAAIAAKIKRMDEVEFQETFAVSRELTMEEESALRSSARWAEW